MKSTVKWSMSILGLLVVLFVSSYAKPAISDIVIYKSTPDNFLLMQQDGYYVPYVKHSEDKFVRGSDRFIDIINNEGFKVENGTKLVSKGKRWFISVPAKNAILVVTEENMKAIKSKPESSIIDSSIRCITGKVNGIWFKDMKVFIPINNNIDMISSRTNERNILHLKFMADGEKYFCIAVNGFEIDVSGATIENVDFLRKNDLMSERSFFYNIYPVVMEYVDSIMQSFGLFYGSGVLILIMLLIMSYDIYSRIRRDELNQNKRIELDIAKRELGNDSVQLEQALIAINNAYAEKDKKFFLPSFVFLVFEGYVQFGVLSDYFGARGIMLGNNDLGLAEIVNFSNLFGLLSSNVLYCIGPLSFVSAIITVMLSNENLVGDSSIEHGAFSFSKLAQIALYIYAFSSRTVFFVLFYLTYVSIKHFFVSSLVKLRSKSDVKFVG